MSKWVLVETVLQYRMRYMVAAPDDHPEWALDTVTCEEAKEFSQHYVGEQIMSHRVVSEDEAIAICDVDNDYVNGKYGNPWSREQKIKTFFTSMDEQGYDPEPVVNHSPYYYDTERNK